MSTKISRAEYLRSHPRASAWAELAMATDQQRLMTPGPVKLEAESFAGKRALVLGAGVGGLTTAYELLVHGTGMAVTVLEAQNRTGGRCLTLRTGDTLTEDVDDELFGSTPSETQVVRFEWPVGDSQPYLNAGPGRIPSSHKRLLNYLREFGVDVEVYVMNSMSNLVHMGEGPLKDQPQVYRQIDHNLRGWIAQMVYGHAEALLAAPEMGIPVQDRGTLTDKLRSLMVTFGELNADGLYAPTAGQEGFENAISRAGFDELPGVSVGEIAKAIRLQDLLDSEYWAQTRFYQPNDFLWQQTIFQPVGGMDNVQRAFARQVAELGGTIHLNSPVTAIDWDAETQEFVVQIARIGTKETTEYRADYCFSNIAMPFLEKLLSPTLRQGKTGGLEAPFQQGLAAVFAAQARPRVVENKGKEEYQDKFLATTTKVGWQGDRTLWQGRLITHEHDAERGLTTMVAPASEEGVVPIFGGISWTSHEIVQIWYPSTGYHDRKGTLTGAYNFGEVACRWGKTPVAERLRMAREGARQLNAPFGDGLGRGVAIAWQNMPYIKGGWAYWQAVGEDATTHFNALSQGSGIVGQTGKASPPVFFVIGDQISSLPGWQEGAIASALNALTRMAHPELAIPQLKTLPDTRLLVEGI